MNGEVEVDDPLSKSTSRLSICQADMEELGEKNPRLQVREFLKMRDNYHVVILQFH